jgi:hypothetical protein
MPDLNLALCHRQIITCQVDRIALQTEVWFAASLSSLPDKIAEEYHTDLGNSTQ